MSRLSSLSSTMRIVWSAAAIEERVGGGGGVGRRGGGEGCGGEPTENSTGRIEPVLGGSRTGVVVASTGWLYRSAPNRGPRFAFLLVEQIINALIRIASDRPAQ